MANGGIKGSPPTTTFSGNPLHVGIQRISQTFVKTTLARVFCRISHRKGRNYRLEQTLP